MKINNFKSRKTIAYICSKMLIVKMDWKNRAYTFKSELFFLFLCLLINFGTVKFAKLSLIF